ncbi:MULTISPECIES: helix-turn-helix domain-containing protein [unclassified Serratia (in: enterobacteria)]|uniref:helix-turn-helix domain-containing protein n=1 Tax=unclassified Serratia (in: enterobacteria) TaxID=2647522 RepID=UPI0005029D99|nr:MULTISPECIES: helix-turn-helix transcriptional regulator [unclassified Serratia (in: enterobacteria)]KFK95265.1 cryptic phage CTXphi transcriptional repressor rstR [Serratia sp. Ag2]KFK98613.1 cryptic phage CTXphi transcriptional repressor rstR [Serratia sp. Ag1]
MGFSTRILQLRKLHGLSQSQMAEKIGIHLTQIRRYESEEANPSLDILKRVAIVFSVSTDWLIFEDKEREPTDEMKLRFEAIKQLDDEELRSVNHVLDAMILMHKGRK